MLNLADEIHDARGKYEALAKRLNEVAAELNEQAPFLSPAHYFDATREIRAQLITVREEIESTLTDIDRSFEITD